MKQIISFKKDIPFSTKIGEITSISLEHSLKMDELDHITGEFIVSGDYRITDISINREPFSYNLPFDITLDTKYNINNAKLDIDDFYYEITNDQILNVNIDVLIDGIEVINEYNIERENEDSKEGVNEEVKEEVRGDKMEMKKEVEIIDTLDDADTIDDREVINLFKEIETPPVDISIEDTSSSDEKIKSLFDSFDDKSETFTTYHVHIVRENDTLDTIIAKYKTTKEELVAYNKIDDLKLGDKIVIPASTDE